MKCQSCNCKLEDDKWFQIAESSEDFGYRLCDVCHASFQKKHQKRCYDCGCGMDDDAEPFTSFASDKYRCAFCEVKRSVAKELDAKILEKRNHEKLAKERAETDRRDQIVEIPLGILEGIADRMEVYEGYADKIYFAFASSDNRSQMCEEMEDCFRQSHEKLRSYFPQNKPKGEPNADKTNEAEGSSS